MDEIVREFMLTGKLKFLEIGMHRYDVQSRLPDLWQHLKRKSKGSSDFRLGSLHLYFRRPFLDSIRIYFNSKPVRLPVHVFEKEFIEEFPETYSDFVTYLKKERIPFSKVFDEDDQIELSIGDGVFVKFVWNKLSHIRRNPTEKEAVEIENKAQATYQRKPETET